MKHKRSIALLLVVATLIALPSRLSAQTYEFRDGNGVYLVEYVPIDELDDDTMPVIKTNYAGFKEVRLGLGYNPATPHGYSSTLEWKDYPLTLPANTELNRTRWFTTNFDAGYWLKRWLYIGGVATWTTGSERVSNCINHKRVDAYNYDNITITNHCGGLTINSYRDAPAFAIRNYLNYAEGKADLAFWANRNQLS